MTQDFLHCYRTLGVAPGAKWSEIRAAYRTRMREWHPDRFAADDTHHEFAEERAKAINEAYRRLSDFYRTHGAPPLAHEHAYATPPHAKARPPQDGGYTGATLWPRRQPMFRARRRQAARAAVLVLALGGVYMIFDPIGYIAQDTATPEAPPVTPPDRRPIADDPLPYFTVGSTLGEVYAAQGVPSRTEGDIWHYGASKIYFSKGRVVRWEETKDSPLRAQLEAHVQPTPAPDYFTRGSTKAHVRRVQGNPVREMDRVWDYGVSHVYFESDRVVGWNESPLNPLKAK